jgi:hypothetical protein
MASAKDDFIVGRWHVSFQVENDDARDAAHVMVYCMKAHRFGSRMNRAK